MSAHACVPDGQVRRGDVHVVEALGQAEDSFEYALSGEVRPQLLFVEVVERFALLFCVVRDIPGFERGNVIALELVTERQKLRLLALEGSGREGTQSLDELRGLLARTGHTVLRHQIGEMVEAEQASACLAKLQNARDDREVLLAWQVRPTLIEREPDLPPEFAVVRVVEHGNDRGRLEAKEVSALATSLGSLTCRSHGGGWQATEAGLVDEELEGVGGVEDVLGETRRLEAEFAVDAFELRLAGGIEPCAMAAKVVQRLLHEALRDGVFLTCSRGRVIGFERAVERCVECDARPERADVWKNGVVGLPQFRGRLGRFEVFDHPHGQLEAFGGSFEGTEGYLVAIARAGTDGVQRLSRLPEQDGDARHDGLGFDAIERERKREIFQRS